MFPTVCAICSFVLVFCPFWVDTSSLTKTVLVGSDVEFSCSSSFAPSWMWFGPKQQRPKTLAQMGTQPHPTLKDNRFQFLQRESTFVIRISKVKSKDAGKFVCDADDYHENELNAVR